jgi:phosphatidylserine decarboxylase
MKWLYSSSTGKVALNILLKRKLTSALSGWFMNSKASKKRIQSFITEYKIEMSDYLQTDASKFKHFNDFFYRKINPAKRPIGLGVVSPTDGKILAFQSISDNTKFFIKGSAFNLKRFLGTDYLTKKYEGGSMLIIRLAPTDYHRYHFPAKGIASETSMIKGHYYSVSPIALRQSLKIFCENKRTISTLVTESYGDILISEVGATMVGSILQTYKVDSTVESGSEKGYFAFGGSTVLLLFEKGKIKISDDLIQNTKKGFETQVLIGQTIGE